MNRNINVTQNHQYKPTSLPKAKTVIVVYEQPKVRVVRRYTRSIIPHVNPDEYRKKFDQTLLDTATLFELTRRLNIQDDMIKMMPTIIQ